MDLHNWRELLDYRNEMKKMMKRREQYFPLFTLLLELYNKRSEFDFPLKIEDASRIALIIELIDIGYLDTDAFTVKKTRGNIDALYYNGSYPLTEKGVEMERSRLHTIRGRYIKIAILLCFILLAAVVYFIVSAAS